MMGARCPDCDGPLEDYLVFTSRRMWVGAWCKPCKQAYNPQLGGVDRAVDLGGVDGMVTVLTADKSLVIHVEGRRVTLPPEQADEFCGAMRSFGATIAVRARSEKIKREQLNRWLLHKDGATFRDLWHGLFEVTLRQTKPRREWNCSKCQRVLPKELGHWIGEYDAKRKYGRPTPPRFCVMCVHESRLVDVSAPEVPKGLRLVENSEGA